MSSVQYDSMTGICKDLFPCDELPNAQTQALNVLFAADVAVCRNVTTPAFDFSPVYGYVASIALSTLSYNALRYVNVRPLHAGILVVTASAVANGCYLINTDNLGGYAGAVIGITTFGTLAYLFNTNSD